MQNFHDQLPQQRVKPLTGFGYTGLGSVNIKSLQDRTHTDKCHKREIFHHAHLSKSNAMPDQNSTDETERTRMLHIFKETQVMPRVLLRPEEQLLGRLSTRFGFFFFRTI